MLTKAASCCLDKAERLRTRHRFLARMFLGAGRWLNGVDAEVHGETLERGRNDRQRQPRADFDFSDPYISGLFRRADEDLGIGG